MMYAALITHYTRLETMMHDVCSLDHTYYTRLEALIYDVWSLDHTLYRAGGIDA